VFRLHNARLDGAQADAVSAISSGLDLLLVDDSEDNRLLFAALIDGCGHRVTTAKNGVEAVQAVKDGEFDIVFMDVQMPILDGYTATQQIRAWEQEMARQPVPIIAFTAHAFESDTQASLRAGCDAHMAKPLKKDVLFAMIDRYSGVFHREI
jgi:CheY-like chemotaxis protein